MTISECRKKHCIHVSETLPRRNCGVTDCYMYENSGLCQKRVTVEEDYEFEDCEDEVE